MRGNAGNAEETLVIQVVKDSSSTSVAKMVLRVSWSATEPLQAGKGIFTFWKCDDARKGQSLVHVEVALQDSLLHGIRNLGLLRHLAGRRLHNGDTFGTLMSMTSGAQHSRRRAGDGTTLRSSTEVLGEIVTFAC